MNVLELMKQRLADAESDAERLRRAIQLLERDGAEMPSDGRKRRSETKRERKKAIPLDKILATVRDEPGLTTTTLAKQLDGEQSQVLGLLKEAEKEGKVRRQGERRATSWFVVTDEDKVAQRAAEIEARSKSPRRAKAA